MTEVVTQANCPPCTITIRHLEKHNIPYRTTDVTELSEEELDNYKSMGLLSTPIVKTAKEIWSGFQPDKIKALAAA